MLLWGNNVSITGTGCSSFSNPTVGLMITLCRCRSHLSRLFVDTDTTKQTITGSFWSGNYVSQASCGGDNNVYRNGVSSGESNGGGAIWIMFNPEAAVTAVESPPLPYVLFMYDNARGTDTNNCRFFMDKQ